MDLSDFLKLYGPMALGWVAAAYLFQRLSAIQDKVMTAFVADTEFKSDLKNALENLKDTIDNFTKGARP